jgi:A/G-specific adenine glycosylase
VERVIARLAAAGSKAAVRAAGEAIYPETRAGDVAQAFMDLGSAICTPKRPRCLLCPLRENCAAFAAGTPEAYSVKPAKKPRPTRHGTVFWLGRGGDVLLVRRPDRGLLGGMRALPTGPWSDAPPGLAGAPAQAEWRMLPATVEHGFTHFRLVLELAAAELPPGSAVEGEWWPADRLAEAGLPTLFARAAERVRVAA